MNVPLDALDDLARTIGSLHINLAIAQAQIRALTQDQPEQEEEQGEPDA